MRLRPLNVSIFQLVGGLVCLSSMAILVAIWFTTNNHARGQIEKELEIGQKVFLEFMQNRENLLFNAASVLTEDFGFKQAVSTAERATIESALQNHGARIDANVMAVFELSGKVAASFTSKQLSIPDLIDSALITNIIEQGGASTLLVIDKRLYHAFFLTVDAPQPIAIGMLGFEVNQSIVERIKSLTGLETSIIFEQMDDNYVSTMGQAIFGQVTINLAPNNQPFESRLPDGNLYISKRFNLSSFPEFTGHVLLSQSYDSIFKEFDVLIKEVIGIGLFSVLAALFFGMIFTRKITQPIQSFAKLAHRISQGDYKSEVKQRAKSKELFDLESAFIEMKQSIAEREEKIQFQATHDSLTGLYSRNKLAETINGLLASARDFQVIAFHINNLREVNETFGFRVGDLCLVHLASKLKALEGVAARLSGDELIWIPHMHREQGELIQLKKQLEQEFQAGDIQLKLQLTIGLANCPIDDKSPDDILKGLSIALSHARSTKSFIQVYQKEQELAYIKRLQVLHLLQELLKNDQSELSMHYQPKLHLPSYSVQKFEALIRWHSDVIGFVSPEFFIPLAERAGLINELTEWVIQRVLSDMDQWQSADIQVAINLSVHDIMRPDLLDKINLWFSDYQLNASRLSFEITESDIMSKPDLAIEQLQKIRQMGFSLSIDDFGTGHSSLSYIKSFPVNELKIDKSFVLKLAQQTEDQTIVKTIINLAKSFNLSVIAEGVEDQQSLSFLAENGCDWIQGYYISKPMQAKAVDSWLQSFHQQVQESI